MKTNHLHLSNLLEIFAESERSREENILRVSQNSEKSISIRYHINKKDLSDIQRMYDRMGSKPVPDSLMAYNLSSAEVFVYNDVLKELAEQIIVEMIKQGLVILEIEDNHFDNKVYNLTLSTLIINPNAAIKRINITRTSE